MIAEREVESYKRRWYGGRLCEPLWVPQQGTVGLVEPRQLFKARIFDQGVHRRGRAQEAYLWLLCGRRAAPR